MVQALWNMQHGKCCYSEMLLPQDGHGKAVEHFRPQSVFTWRRNDWDNLLLVCPQCNGRKSDQFPTMLTDTEHETKVVYLRRKNGAVAALINPANPADDPETHLTYVLDDREVLYGQVIPRNGSERGLVTIKVTGIDDDIFFRERFSRLIEVLDVHYRNILRAKKDGNAESLNAHLTTFSGFLAPTAAFAGLARAYARYKKLDERFALAIP